MSWFFTTSPPPPRGGACFPTFCAGRPAGCSFPSPWGAASIPWRILTGCSSAGRTRSASTPGAIRNPDLIRQAALRYGSQCVVLSADVKRVDGQFRVFGRGGRDDTGMEAIGWIKHCVDLGAGEVVVNSIDTDGVKGGFDLEMLAAVCQAVKVPVIASGGAGRAEDFVRLFQTLPGVDAGLAASVFHFGEIAIPHLKAQLRQAGISVR